MFKKTILLKRKWRLTLVVLLHAVLLALALAPLLIGLLGMKLDELSTGVTQSEANSVWGVLPWMAMFTVAAFWPFVTLLFNLTMACIVHDIITLFRQKRASLTLDEGENPSQI
jgi:apolipoprotein N-acyltransferase